MLQSTLSLRLYRPPNAQEALRDFQISLQFLIAGVEKRGMKLEVTHHEENQAHGADANVVTNNLKRKANVQMDDEDWQWRKKFAADLAVAPDFTDQKKRNRRPLTEEQKREAKFDNTAPANDDDLLRLGRGQDLLNQFPVPSDPWGEYM